MSYVAGYNMPGYLPDSEPVEFDTSDEAMDYIADAAVRHFEEDDDIAEDTFAELRRVVARWRADDNGEFGLTLGPFHYFVTRS